MEGSFLKFREAGQCAFTHRKSMDYPQFLYGACCIMQILGK